MPQTVTDPTQLEDSPNDVDQFLAQLRSSQTDDDVTPFLKQFRSSQQQGSTDAKIATPDIVGARARKDGTSTGKAVENLRAEGWTTAPFPYSDPRSSRNPATFPIEAEPEPQSTIPIVPFKSPVPTQPLDQRAAQMGASMLPPLTPPATDTTQTPLNVFENAPQRPPQPNMIPAPPKSPMDENLEQEQAFEDKAHQQGDALVSKLSTGSKKLPLPYMAPDGSLRTMKLGDFQQLASDYLNDPSIPKSQGAAFAAGYAADVVSTLNDVFLSPAGLASTVTGLTAARALQGAGKAGTEALNLARQYQEMKQAGASAEELADQQELVRQAIISAAQSQKVAVGARSALQAAGLGYGMQGANNFINGVQRKDFPTALGGFASLLMGAGALKMGLSPADAISEGVKAETAKAASDNLNEEAAPEESGSVPFRAPGEKNVTSQGSHEIVRPPQLHAPRESVGAGEELTPEKPETLQAQVDALADGTNPVVYIRKGQTNAPAPPEGAQVTEVASDKPGAGTYYHDDSVTPEEIKSAVKDGTYGSLLGNIQTKAEAIGTGTTQTPPVAVTARDDQGNEVQSSLVAGDSSEAQTAQSAKLAEKYPTAKIGVETPEQVVSARQSNATPTAPQTAASPETPQASEGGGNDVEEFLQQHREARSIIEPQTEELSGLAKQLQHIDPHAADASNGLADGRYFSQEDLLKIAEGIRNAKTANDLRSIVNEYGGSKAAESAPSAASASSAKGSTSPEGATTAEASSTQPVREHVHQVREQPEGVREAEGENRNQLGPQEAPAKVGQRVVGNRGPLKGKTIEVTKVGATGVYGHEEGGSPIRFLKTGEFGPLLDTEGKPITTGPGTPLRDAFDTTGTRIQQLAQTIRENISGSKPISERMDYADKVAESQAKAKDETSVALGKVKGAMAAMWDAYTKPPKWTDYEDALGKYQGAIQKSAFGLKQFAQQIKKAVPDPKRREAITAFIEAAGDRATLEKWANEAKPKFKAGYKAALTLTNVEQTIARNIIATQDERFELDKAAGLLEHEVDNYVMHAWKRENPYTKKLVSNVRAQMLQTKPSFTKQRVFGTFFDGEKAGYSPVSKDIGFLFAAREHAADQAIAARAFIKSMLDGKAPDGRPLVAVSGSGRPIGEEEKPAKAYLIDARMKPEDIADYRPIDHPALRKWTWATNESIGKPVYVKGDMVVHPEAYAHLKNVLGRSALRSFALSRAILDVNATIKSSLMSFSGFHQTQESLHAIFHRINPTSTKPVDFSSPKQAKLIDHGLQVASFDAQEEFSEGLASGLTERIPLVGGYLRRYNDYLFSDYIPRLKMAMAREALERNLKRYAGKISEDQIYALTANQANAAFGELNYTMLGRNRTMQDVLRMALLAPDFLEARGRFVGQALKPYGREQAVALIVGALGLYVAARLLNEMLTGHPRWEGENAFVVVYKGRSYTLRSVPGDILHLFTDPRGFFYNRLSPIGRAAVEGTTGRDQYGRKQSVTQQAKDFVGEALPIPFQGYRKRSESGPLETGLTAVGISTAPYLSPAERIARNFTLDRMPLGEDSADRKDANQLARELEDRLRKKQITPLDVTRLRQQGKITPTDQKQILARAARTPLQNSFRSLTPQEAIEVWDKADADERKQVRPLLANKLSRLDSVPQDQRTKLRSKILFALHGGNQRVASSGVPMRAPSMR
jgi:hypothetical protein